MANWENASRMDCISGISKMLAVLSANVKINSKNNRNDLAVISEQTICGLLNRMYGWNLRNANTPKRPNFPGVDLVDEIAGVAVQVTVDNSVKKVDHTLEKFKEYKLNRTFNRLILMVISEDEPTPAMKNREDSCFYGERDIWNITFLSREIGNEQNVDKLRDIARYLEKELGYGFRAPVKDMGKNVESADPVKPVAPVNDTTEHTGNVALETQFLLNTDTGEYTTKILGDTHDKTFETTVIQQENGGTKTVETTVLIRDHDKTEGSGEQAGDPDTKEPKEPFLKAVARKIKSRKQKRQEKKEQKKTKRNPPKKRFWLLVPVVLLVVWLISMIPEKKLEEMPAELADYSVTINGETVSLPTTLQRLEEMGWTLKDAEKYMQIQVPAHSYYGYYGENEYWGGSATLTNGHGTMEIRLGNASNHTVSFEECIVYQITCYSAFDSSYTGESVNTLETPLGLVWKQTSYRDIKWPRGYTKNELFGLTYSYQLSDYQQYEFQFDQNSKKLKYLKITNRDEAAMAAMLGDAYDTQPPEYDAEALAQWLGLKMVFQVENHEFPVGGTVAEYQDLGYVVEKQPEYIVSKDHDDVYFRCDALNQLHASACNPFRRALTPENCFICTLDSWNIDAEQTVKLCVTCGEQTVTVAVGEHRNQINELLELQTFSGKVGEDGQYIICVNENSTVITVWVSSDTNNITRIRVNICDTLQSFMEQQETQNDPEE